MILSRFHIESLISMVFKYSTGVGIFSVQLLQGLNQCNFASKFSDYTENFEYGCY